jgi:hypothetical protein
MKQLISKLAIGAAALAIASAPLAASAQDWHHDRNVHQRVVHREMRNDRRWHEGYRGASPAGWNGYYHNGGWYHNRRMRNGIYIYF